MSSRLSTERGEKRPHSPQGNATQPAGKHTALVPNAVVTHHHATQCSRLSQEHAIAQEHAMGYVQPAEERNEVDNEPDSKPDNVEEEETGNERENDTGTPFGETLVRTLDPSRDLEDLIQDLALLRVEAPEKEIFTDADLKSFVRESVGLIRRKQWKGESAKFTTIDFVRPQKLPFVMYGSFLSEAQTQTWKDWAEGEGNEIALFISSVDFTICTLARADALAHGISLDIEVFVLLRLEIIKQKVEISFKELQPILNRFIYAANEQSKNKDAAGPNANLERFKKEEIIKNVIGGYNVRGV